MQEIRAEQARATIEFDRQRARDARQRLNEVCHGVTIPAFQTRLGFEKHEVEALLNASTSQQIRLSTESRSA